MSAGLSATELETYEYQLSQIKLALAKDPDNAEYLNLKEELQSLIDLTKEFLASQQQTGSHGATASASSGTSGTKRERLTQGSGSPTRNARAAAPVASGASDRTTAVSGSMPTGAAPQHNFKTGDECQARYSGDGKFYPARITSIGGSDTNRVYSVIFHGYSTTELVDGKNVKPLNDSKKREMTAALTKEDEDKERKRKKYEKKAEVKAAKTAEQGERQKTWQSFAKKSSKKGVVIPGFRSTGGSMFKSPEDLNPNAKVGVVGSGRGMSKTADRKRQTFLGGADE
ncbi:hypothetical protein OIV83_001948 [Microbotryomycetes sp. JL201]|nr:hypothetical protein OIV83_001948 [Microbotryomycetes sp. JL201]